MNEMSGIENERMKLKMRECENEVEHERMNAIERKKETEILLALAPVDSAANSACPGGRPLQILL
jgi:hypothetical protein